jgi:hypothetical protein
MLDDPRAGEVTCTLKPPVSLQQRGDVTGPHQKLFLDFIVADDLDADSLVFHATAEARGLHDHFFHPFSLWYLFGLSYPFIGYRCRQWPAWALMRAMARAVNSGNRDLP